MLVIRHVDRLERQAGCTRCASALQEAWPAERHTALRVAVTLNRKRRPAPT